MDQPRQPKDLQGLLKFCIEATKAEDAPEDAEATLAAMDPQRRQWLEQALSGMSVDVIKELVEAIKVLNSPSVQDPNASEEEIEKIEYVFDCIGDWVGQVDMANNFHKVGGFDSLSKCLKSPHASVRCQAANIMAELSQNNPYCQENFVKEQFLELLFQILTSDVECQVKAMYAISCIIRECPMAQDKFLEMNGPSLVMNTTMESKSDKLRIKACFFISALCEENPTVKKAFIDMGFPRQILTLMQMEDHQQSHEHMTRALLVVLTDEVKKELVNSSELNLKSFLQERLDAIKGQEEFDEERTYLQEIAKVCYGGQFVTDSKSVDR